MISVVVFDSLLFQSGEAFFFLFVLIFFFSSRRRHTRCREVSWARRCVQETGINAEYMGRRLQIQCGGGQQQRGQQRGIFPIMPFLLQLHLAKQRNPHAQSQKFLDNNQSTEINQIITVIEICADVLHIDG
eukprot:TRINITY_DN58931_c0_g1_i1.p3 TRINITY_DN58931_c0_g1~~TRINITY_DN58931_c0_g1_i1.p3  ORF type:complete len:131 (+),score=44.04 TRINITY_DN58931_c0_g1_i1:57-449(+)